jgi:hypothetical protein
LGGSLRALFAPLDARSFALVVLLASTLGLGCAHTQNESRAEALKRTADTFHQRIRWKDFRGAAELIVPERQELFEKARKATHDDRDLNITDYEVDTLRMEADGARAHVISHVSWIRLPSVSEKSEEVTSEFVWRGGAWLLARQQGGPFAEELAPPLAEPAAINSPGTPTKK